MTRISLKTGVNFIVSHKYLLFVILCSGLYAGIMSLRTMPFAEGWYTYYAELINEGKIVYKDFDYLFSPLYIYFIALLTRLFGYKIIVLRLVGILFYCMIATLLYLIIKELFEEAIACIASICAVFYVQSEIVQVFYDYVRMMDIFSCLTTLLLIKAVKRSIDTDKYQKSYCYFALAGLSNSAFFLIKQNMGLIFFAYAVVLIVFIGLYYKVSMRDFAARLGLYLFTFCIPVIITMLLMLKNDCLFDFLSATGSNAIAAKGGMTEILFGWLINNITVYKQQTSFAIRLFIILLAAMLLNRKFKIKGTDKINEILAVALTCLVCIGIFLIACNESFAQKFSNHSFLSPYGLFLFITPLFFYFAVILTFNYFGVLLKNQYLNRYILLLTVSGSYFAISFGCGTSGGLAEGQAGIGVALTISIFLRAFRFRYSQVIKIIFTILCLLFTLQSAEKKMDTTYNWWGMDESDFWSCTEETDIIPLLKGIKLSSETKNAYETIYKIITENVEKDEPIYCFPQIPVFYSLCDRSDPGVKAKVQWFDVVSDISLEQDMLVLEKNPPKAVLIYQTSDYAYNSHETLFRSGEISGTRKMKNYLMDFVQKYDYQFYGEITSTESNSFLLYYKKDNNYEEKHLFSGGTGSRKDPFIISTPEELIALSEQVNNGRDFSGQYILQSADIDLAQCANWTPIGIYNSGRYFKGTYNGNGYAILNIRITKGGNAGLFGVLGGTVSNLQLKGGYIEGDCCGAIASHALSQDAMIINCFTDVTVSGLRAGGIADNFIGKITNCYAMGKCSAIEYANAVSYNNSAITNVYALASQLNAGIISGANYNYSVNLINEDYLKSDTFVSTLNSMVDILQKDDDIELLHWCQTDNGYPQFARTP